MGAKDICGRERKFVYNCFSFFWRFYTNKFLEKTKSDKSQKMSISVPIHSNFANILNFGFVLVFADVY